ncbi:isoprenylcysteine carboxylmethyltransferase family protein [uncultured Kordia sp.]|uniref:methyltransferase family protein n=1 Tax=uncultured Kordia sp. TaxID=507699 RepID=UPI002620780C|nr:isoprenylcysteine carboxylmethyltransferase family protein [uncultured Kordia sp.]
MALQEEFKTQGDYLFKNRSKLPLLILIVALGVYGYMEYSETETEREDFFIEAEYVYLLVSLFGLFLRIITVGFTPKNTSGRNTADGQLAAKLNTTGMYSLVRHPLYLGNFFMWLGLGLMTESFWFIISFILIYFMYYERIMFAEESFLRKKFGDKYLQWAVNTPAIIPSFKTCVKPAYFFSWRKVLKKEKNGFTAVFLLFWLFEVIGESIENHEFSFEFNFWSIAAFASLIIYLILKYIKKKTNWFEEAYR